MIKLYTLDPTKVLFHKVTNFKIWVISMGLLIYFNYEGLSYSILATGGSKMPTGRTVKP